MSITAIFLSLRLEQLDQSDSSDLRQMLNLSQADYISKISDLQKALKAAWDSDQRVMSIRIAIQSAKLLADTSVVQFYPSKFVLITDILDSFGQLVFDRLMAKANSLLPVEKQLDSNTFDSSEVPESAKETCRNWFYKIASIRELLPRLYVESAILKSLKFLDPTEHSKVLKRLCLMARGIGDPLVAAFARCYLCRVASKTDPSNPDYSRLCFDDILSTYSQVVSTSKRLSVEQKISFRKYFDLYSPAVEWILRSNTSLSQNQEELLPLMLEKCRVQRSEILLKAILVSFRPQLVANCATELIQMIKETTELSQTPIADQIQNEKNMSTRATLLKALGGCLTLSPPAGIDPLKILNDVWKLIMRLGSTYDYAVCAAVWMEFASRNFGTHEVDTLLRDVVSHVTPDRAYEQLYPQLKVR